MNSESSSRPRRPLLFRIVRTLFFLALGLVTLVALVWAFENWRGERDWQAVVRAHAAKGDPLDAPAVIPAAVPDEQNFAMTPLLKPLLEYDLVQGQAVFRDSNAIARMDAIALPTLKATPEFLTNGRANLAAWQTAFRATNVFPVPPSPGTPAADILAALGRWQSELTELDSASRRPYTRFNVHYQDDVNALLPHLARGKQIGRILALRCTARLAAGDTDGALADIEFNERWAHALAADPLLINQLVAIALETIGTHMAWEGLADHRWGDAQLQRLQALFAARTPRADILRAFRGERAFGLATMDRWLNNPQAMGRDLNQFAEQPANAMRWIPRGFVRQNQVSFVRYHELLAAQAELWGADQLPTSQLGKDPLEQLVRERPRVYSTLTTMLAPAMVKAMQKTDRLLTISRMAEIACALERYRLVNQNYPESLDLLKPTFLAALPADPCTGQPFRYQRTNDGWYRLYSLGPNGRDDGGDFVPDDAKADWLWPLPIPTPKRMF